MSYTKYFTDNDGWYTCYDVGSGKAKENQLLFINGYGSYRYPDIVADVEKFVTSLGGDDELRHCVNAFIEDVEKKFKEPELVPVDVAYPIAPAFIENVIPGDHSTEVMPEVNTVTIWEYTMGLIRALFLHGNQLRRQLVEARRERRAELRKYVWWTRLLILMRARRILVLKAQTEIMKADNK